MEFLWLGWLLSMELGAHWREFARQLGPGGAYELRREGDPSVMHKLPDIAVIASAWGRF